jgi:hypothetical protein
MKKKREQQYYLQDKESVAFRIVGPMKQFYPKKVNKIQEKEEEDLWYVIEFNVYSLTQLQIYININYMLMLKTT